jgi:hypothetical protein
LAQVGIGRSFFARHGCERNLANFLAGCRDYVKTLPRTGREQDFLHRMAGPRRQE